MLHFFNLSKFSLYLRHFHFSLSLNRRKRTLYLLCKDPQLIILLFLDLTHNILERIIIRDHASLILGLVQELEGLILRLLEEVSNGEELIMKGDNLILLSVLELKREDVEDLIRMGVDVRDIVDLVTDHLVELFSCRLLRHLWLD